MISCSKQKAFILLVFFAFLLVSCDQPAKKYYDWSPRLTEVKGILTTLLKELPLGKVLGYSQFPAEKKPEDRGKIVITIDNVDELLCFVNKQVPSEKREEKLAFSSLVRFKGAEKGRINYAYAVLLKDGEPSLEKKPEYISSFSKPLSSMNITYRYKTSHLNDILQKQEHAVLHYYEGDISGYSYNSPGLLMTPSVNQNFIVFSARQNNLYLEIGVWDDSLASFGDYVAYHRNLTPPDHPFSVKMAAKGMVRNPDDVWDHPRLNLLAKAIEASGFNFNFR